MGSRPSAAGRGPLERVFAIQARDSRVGRELRVSWPEAMGLVVVDGLIIMLLAATGFRTAVFNTVPAELKAAITVGIGLFISFIGLVLNGVLVARRVRAATLSRT